MDRTKGLIAGIIALILLGGLLMWFILTRTAANSELAQPQSQQGAAQENNKNVAVQSGAVSVKIEDFAFSPQILRVKKGTTVTWTNQDTVGHNAVAADKVVDGGLPANTPLLDKGQSYSFTFNQTGTFAYVCAPHPQMKATVEVVE